MSIVDDVPTEPFSGVMLHTIQQWQTKKGEKPLTASIEKHSSNQVQLVLDSKAPWSYLIDTTIEYFWDIHENKKRPPEFFSTVYTLSNEN